MSQSLNIVASWDGDQVGDVRVDLRRPSGAPLLLGRSASEVVEWVPRLYSLCARAQGVAARLAVEAARGRTLAGDANDACALLAEQAREHLWRLLRDWPPLLGLPARDADVARWFRRLSAADPDTGSELIEYLATDLLDAAPRDWRQLRSRDELVHWARTSSAHGARLVAALIDDDATAREVACLDPALRAADFAAAAWDADYARAPTWRGAPAETGVYARWRSHPLLGGGDGGLLARLLARLLDLVDVADKLSRETPLASLADATCVADNTGLARVDTARGILLHRVEMKGDKVASYAVVAPTEWNFHPQGAFAAAARLRGRDEDGVRRDLSRWVTAFDPCVDWDLEVRRA